MRPVLLLALVVCALGCTRRGDPQGDAAAPAQNAASPSQEAAAAVPAGSLPPGWWEARSELPAQGRGGLFQGREPNAPLQRPPPPVRPVATVPQAAAGPPPPSLAYVGKVVRDGEGYAVLLRDERVYMVSVGDAVGNGYRVRSISVARRFAIEAARVWIGRAGSAGGVSAQVSQSFVEPNAKRGERIDIEVRKGRAFVP